MITTEKFLKELEEKCRLAHNEINNLAQGKREWTMTIPAQTTDSDMILQAPIDDIKKLLKVIGLYREALKCNESFHRLGGIDDCEPCKAIADANRIFFGGMGWE